jgi:redox-sensitive bicupin YhaK (pirin superfamily)
METTSPASATAGRRIRTRTAGHTHGPITRLMSPGDLGQLLKPFVFLDRFELPEGVAMPEMPTHPHSGISTHTTLLEGSLAYVDSTGKSGVLPPQSVEYMQAGGGVWHGGRPVGTGRMRGFQLWLALPPELELTPAESHYVDPAQIPSDGRVRVLLGSYAGVRSVVPSPWPATYLHVTLRDGEAWRYTPAPDHEIAWLAPSYGAVRVDGVELRRELAVFEDGHAPIDLVAVGDTELVIASGKRHPHALVTGMYSVHTSAEALALGEAGYRRLAAEARRAEGARRQAG